MRGAAADTRDPRYGDGFLPVQFSRGCARTRSKRTDCSVAIADFDVHHGSTQDISQRSACNTFRRINRRCIRTGAVDERGVGNIHNIPLRHAGQCRVPRCVGRSPAAEDGCVRPQLVLVSAGFDAHRLDPLTNRGRADDFGWITRNCARLPNASEGRLVSLLEGGYSMEALRACSIAHIRELLD